jgi:hypothetical protein
MPAAGASTFSFIKSMTSADSIDLKLLRQQLVMGARGDRDVLQEVSTPSGSVVAVDRHVLPGVGSN